VATLTAPIHGRAAWRRTLEVKQRYLAAGDPDRLPPTRCGVRPEIVSSWRRSLLSGVDAAGTDLPRDDDAARPDRLVRAAQPVADRLADQLAGMPVWAFLADRECRLVWYVVGEPELARLLEARGAFPGAWFAEGVVGTNGLGTAVEERRPFIVAGSEHFREYESHATTVGAPVHDPLTGRLVGILNVNCRYERTNGLLLPFVTELARSIEAGLHRSAPMPEQVLLDEFIRTCKRGMRPVVALSQDLVIANAAARALLRGIDAEPLRHWACDAAAEGRERTATLRLSPTLVVTARCRPLAGVRHPCAVVVLAPCAPGRGPATSAPPEHLVEALAQAHAGRLPLLLRGERGTGKTTLARRVHQRAEPDTPLNILDAAASVGHPDEWLAELRQASTDQAGTVVVRHLDELPPALVAPTARLLDTPRGWLVATATGERADLAPVLEAFAVVVDVPPLREQTADLPTLVAEIIAALHPQSPRPRVTGDALATLAGGEWPGNLRQLRQVLATALMRSRSGQITVDDLPGDLATAGQRHLTKLERLERQALVTALRETAWDREAAAHDLGISRATIYRKLKRFGIQSPTAPDDARTGVDGD
jgi:sigma-54 dependent transcriptional regulator, acetoin dehydrogenase operon transcriptional activator AcoR